MYKTRQEVLRAAAGWMDVCEKAGIEAKCKVCGIIRFVSNVGFCSLTHELDAYPNDYEFPLALLEGKEVWVGSELWCCISNHKFTVKGLCNNGIAFEYATVYDGRVCVSMDSASWNPPKPKTVMVEMLVEDAEEWSRISYEKSTNIYKRISTACKKALENLK